MISGIGIFLLLFYLHFLDRFEETLVSERLSQEVRYVILKCIKAYSVFDVVSITWGWYTPAGPSAQTL